MKSKLSLQMAESCKVKRVNSSPSNLEKVRSVKRHLTLYEWAAAHVDLLKCTALSRSPGITSFCFTEMLRIWL